MEDLNNKEWNGTYVDLFSDGTKISQTLCSGDGMERLHEVYKEISDNDVLDFMSFQSHQSITVKKELMDGKFGKGKYNDVLDFEEKPSDAYVLYKANKYYETHVSAGLRAAQMDLNAYQMLDLKVDEGEGFTKENLTLDSDEDCLPVVLGHNYLGRFSIGETFEMDYLSDEDEPLCNVKVVGILKKGERMPAKDGTDDWVVLDDYMIEPMGANIIYSPSDQKRKKMYANNQYLLVFEAGVFAAKERHTYNDAIHLINGCVEEKDTFRILFSGTSFGTELLQNETETTIYVYGILAVVMLIFLVFCLMTACLNRFYDNVRNYAVYMMNGCSHINLLLAFVIEMLLVITVPVIVSYSLLKEKMYLTGNYAPIYVIITLAVLIIGSTTVLIAYKLTSLNIEEYMRRE
ncbi:MAG: hypothetical protein K6G65_06665 [Lachnospiraceae bacterium]|nr:hypothetical protein [Lachnospiraceae bacterium]